MNPRRVQIKNFRGYRLIIGTEMYSRFQTDQQPFTGFDAQATQGFTVERLEAVFRQDNFHELTTNTATRPMHTRIPVIMGPLLT